MPATLPWDQADLTIQLARSKWAAFGVTYPDGKALPNDDMPASLLLPMGRTGPAFLAYANFAAYTEWKQLADLFDHGRLSRHPHRRRRTDAPAGRTGGAICRSTSCASCSNFWCAPASMSAKSTA